VKLKDTSGRRSCTRSNKTNLSRHNNEGVIKTSGLSACRCPYRVASSFAGTLLFSRETYRWYLKPKSSMMGHRHVLLASITCGEFPTSSNYPVKPSSMIQTGAYPLHILYMFRVETWQSE